MKIKVRSMATIYGVSKLVSLGKGMHFIGTTYPLYMIQVNYVKNLGLVLNSK